MIANDRRQLQPKEQDTLSIFQKYSAVHVIALAVNKDAVVSFYALSESLW
jgi:hypothetical protein